MGNNNTTPIPKPILQPTGITNIGGVPVSSNPVAEMSASTSSATLVISQLEKAIRLGVFEDLKEPNEQGISK